MSLPIIDEPVVSRALAEAWRDTCEDEAQARRAYARFGRRSASRPGVRAVASWVLAGLLLSVGSLYAATSVVPAIWGRASVPKSAEVPTLPSAPVVLPRVAEVSSPSPSTVPSVALVPSSRAPSAPSVVRAPPSDVAEQWQRAARGLRDRDFTSADAALRELTSGTAGAEREAAQLAHAQLLLSHDRKAEARSLLQALQSGASSSSVRRKASELLARDSESAAAKRSFEAPAGAKEP